MFNDSGRGRVEQTAFQLKGRHNASAYRQFFGTDSRIPEMQGRSWADRLRLAWARTLAEKKPHKR
jgi:hypothetical protein